MTIEIQTSHYFLSKFVLVFLSLDPMKVESL